MNTAHTNITKKLHNNNSDLVNHKFFEIIGILRNSKISINNTLYNKLYQSLTEKDNNRVKKAMGQSHYDFLESIRAENAKAKAKAKAKAEAEANANAKAKANKSSTTNAKYTNKARSTRRISTNQTSRRSSINSLSRRRSSGSSGSSGYSSVNN